ncbi:MAG: (2Fe-2S) ferredoxin domain-containing protein [Bdellovibrionaceae bacterium]|nr:(2Fe-2S) ferredoxin domain-containing protein [Pseudobdellovibrionaceae bacterium]
MDDRHSDFQLDAHLFVCTNVKANGECCGAKGAAELRDQLKQVSRDPASGWGKRVRVNNSGCLGHCEKGIVAVLYPQGQWFMNLTSADVPKLVEAVNHALKNKPTPK